MIDLCRPSNQANLLNTSRLKHQCACNLVYIGVWEYLSGSECWRGAQRYVHGRSLWCASVHIAQDREIVGMSGHITP